jgi:hypothetical protein
MAAIITRAGNTVVPALLALETLGFEASLEDGLVVATSENGRFVAADPVAVLGLVKLVETRSWDWKASDERIDATLRRFGWSAESQAGRQSRARHRVR